MRAECKVGPAVVAAVLARVAIPQAGEFLPVDRGLGLGDQPLVVKSARAGDWRRGHLRMLVEEAGVKLSQFCLPLLDRGRGSRQPVAGQSEVPADIVELDLAVTIAAF